MATVGYITPQDAVDAMGEPTYMAIFDDTNSGVRATVDASTGVVSTLKRAHARAAAILPRVYSAFPPESPAGIPAGGDQIPILLKDLEVQIFSLYAYRRHSEYVKTYGADPGGSMAKEIKEMAEAIATAALIILPTDNPPQPNPANVGGVVHSGTATAPADPLLRYFADGTSDF